MSMSLAQWCTMARISSTNSRCMAARDRWVPALRTPNSETCPTDRGWWEIYVVAKLFSTKTDEPCSNGVHILSCTFPVTVSIFPQQAKKACGKKRRMWMYILKSDWLWKLIVNLNFALSAEHTYLQANAAAQQQPTGAPCSTWQHKHEQCPPRLQR